MTVLTFLRPLWAEAFTAKTYQLQAGKPVKTNDYKLGNDFEGKLVNISDLGDLHMELSDHAEGYIRINGQPLPDVDLTNCKRQKVFFPECESDLMMLDLDDWKVDFDWAFTPESVHKTVRRLLLKEGFDYLLGTQYVCLLTSSQFDTQTLRAHLYFLLDEPIDIVRLRDWTEALKKIRGWKVFDPAVERSVQPDYIGRRCCSNFEDPLPEDTRLSHYQEGAPRLSKATLDEHITRLIGQAGITPGQSHLNPVGKNWLATLAMCGNDGINEPAFRAAAQLTQEVGQETLLEKIDHYAQLMHQTAWEAIDAQPVNERNRVEDRQTYTVARFKQYLTSASQRPFGKDADELKKLVMDAIATGSLQGLYDQHVVDAAAKLKIKHPGMYADVKKALKKAGVTVSEYEKLYTGGTSNTAEATTDSDWFDATLAAFDWMEDNMGTKFCGWNHPEDGRYRIMPVDTPLATTLGYKGSKLSGMTTSQNFGKNCLGYLVGEESHNAGGPASRFKKAEIGIRVAPNNGSATWIHLGMQSDGEYLCAKVSADGVELIADLDCPIKWRDNQQSIPIEWPTEERFDSLQDLKDWTVKRLFDFFVLHDDQQPTLMGIIFSLLSGQGTSPLIEFIGPPASGKSTAGDLLLDLVDPIKGGLTDGAGRSTLRGVKVDNLINVVSARYLTFFDNVSKLDRDWQDALCQVATGANKDERVLYVGTFFKVFAKRPILMTALASVVTRPDLASRKETFNFQSGTTFPISSEVMIEQWIEDKPYLFKGLLHLLSDALKEMRTSKHVTGQDARRRWFTLADSLFYSKAQIEEVMEAREYDRARSQFDGSDFCLGLAAWLQSLTDLAITETPRHLYDQYKSWLYTQNGIQLNIRSNGDLIHWTCNPHTACPETVNGFYWDVSKFASVVKDVIGWEIDLLLPRTNGGRKRRMYKILTEADL